MFYLHNLLVHLVPKCQGENIVGQLSNQIHDCLCCIFHNVLTSAKSWMVCIVPVTVNTVECMYSFDCYQTYSNIDIVCKQCSAGIYISHLPLPLFVGIANLHMRGGILTYLINHIFITFSARISMFLASDLYPEYSSYWYDNHIKADVVIKNSQPPM